MADTPEETQQSDDTNGSEATSELASMVAHSPRRPDITGGATAATVAAELEALGADDLAGLDDDTLLRAGTIMLGDGHPDLAARCFSALDSRESVAGLARLGLAWVSWSRGETEACAEGLSAAAQLDSSLRLWPEGVELSEVRARAGAVVVLAAKDDDGEHDIERVTLGRALRDGERTALTEAGERLSALDAPAVAGYRALENDDDGVRVSRDARAGQTLAQTLGDEPRPLEDALSIVAPLAEGLAAAHEQGVIHGLVCADLVTMTDDGPVLRGLGLAGLAPPSPAQVAAGVISPERLAGHAPCPKCDAYGLGALLYRLAGSRRKVGLRNLELCFPASLRTGG